LLQSLVPGVETDPVQARRGLQQAFESEPVQFLLAFMELARRGETGPGMDYVAGLLTTKTATFDFLSNPVLCNFADAVSLAKRILIADPGLDVKLAQHARESKWLDGDSDVYLIRLLEVLSQISSGNRILPSLMQMLRREDPRIKSKVALLIGRVNKDAYWVESYLSEADPRVRANVVEALYGDASPNSVRILRQALRDVHHRVVANAWVGLYLAGETDAAEGLMRMSQSQKEWFQAASAWGMGRCADEGFIPTLQELGKSKYPTVRRCAIRALVAIQGKNQARRSTKSTSNT